MTIRKRWGTITSVFQLNPLLKSASDLQCCIERPYLSKLRKFALKDDWPQYCMIVMFSMTLKKKTSGMHLSREIVWHFTQSPLLWDNLFQLLSLYSLHITIQHFVNTIEQWGKILHVSILYFLWCISQRQYVLFSPNCCLCY